MSNKTVIIKRNNGDKAKYDQLAALGAAPYLEYSTPTQLSTLASTLGEKDYLLVTGGHGNFTASKPTRFNDAAISNLDDWLAKSSGSIKAIILDTCFSSAVATRFIPRIAADGCVICAHGSGEGWAEGFHSKNGAKTVGEVLSASLDGGLGLGLTSALGLLVQEGKRWVLYTMNAGGGRAAAMTARASMGLDGDSAGELGQLDSYLQGEGVRVIEATDAKLKDMLKEKLPMTIA